MRQLSYIYINKKRHRGIHINTLGQTEREPSQAEKDTETDITRHRDRQKETRGQTEKNTETHRMKARWILFNMTHKNKTMS